MIMQWGSSMNRSIDVEFIYVNELPVFAIINVTINNMSGIRAKKYLNDVCQNLGLLKILKSNDIEYSIFGCGDNGALMIKEEQKSNKPEPKNKKAQQLFLDEFHEVMKNME